MNLTKEHCAKVLNRWAEHYVEQAKKRHQKANDALREENVQLRIAQAVEEERKRVDPYYGVGWSSPTTDQMHIEAVKRAELEFSVACRELLNNEEMAQYIKEITSK